MEPKLKSKFSFWSLLVLATTIFSGWIIHAIHFDKIPSGDSELPDEFYIFFLLIAFVFLFFGELRKNCVSVRFYDDKMEFCRFFGLSKTHFLLYSEIDHIKTLHLPSRTGTYEYLVFYVDGKRRFTISKFYHRNFTELKKCSKKHIKYKGVKDFSYIDSFLDIFR